MLKQKKSLDTKLKFHNKFITYLYSRLKKKKIKKLNQQPKTKRRIFKNKKYRTRKLLRRLRRLRKVFNGCYNPTHLQYVRLLSLQKRYRHYIKFNAILKKLKVLKKLKINKRLVFLKKLKKHCLKYKKFLKKHKRLYYSITVKICRNNIFCTISEGQLKKTLIYACSAGMLKTKLSKKTFKFNSRRILNKFFNTIKKRIKPTTALAAYAKKKELFLKKTKKKLTKKEDLRNKLLFIPRIYVYAKMVSPAKMRRRLVSRFLRMYRTNHYMRVLVLNVLEKKIFNGCRPKKKRRKKRQGLRIFK